MKFFVILALLSQFAFAFFSFNENSYSNVSDEIKILKSLDIDTSFAQDKHYIKMKNEIDKLKTKYFLQILEQGQIFVPILRKMISESNIPDTFLYMAMVESKFKIKATSHKNAKGLWQFIPKTAKTIGLKQNRYIDERLDPIKSTQAAIKYLNYLHDRFQKWYLVAIAYNCGESRLARAIKRAKTDKLSVLIDNQKKYLPKESRDYIRKIIIMALLANNKDLVIKNGAEHLFNTAYNSTLIKVYAKGGMSLKKIAKAIGVSYKKLKEYNHHIKRGVLPPTYSKYHIYIPSDRVVYFNANFSEPTYKAENMFIYRVKKGDNLSKISRKYNLKISTIKRLNNLNKDLLKIGDTLTLYANN